MKEKDMKLSGEELSDDKLGQVSGGYIEEKYTSAQGCPKCGSQDLIARYRIDASDKRFRITCRSCENSWIEIR